MILWINGAFGSGKTTTAYELHRRLKPLSYVYDPENVGYFLRKNEPIWLCSSQIFKTNHYGANLILKC